MIRRLQILFVFLLFFSSFAQKKDSLLLQLEKKVNRAPSDSIKIETLIALGTYQLAHDFSDAEKHLTNALRTLKNARLKDKRQQFATIYKSLGVVNKRKGNYPEAVEYYLKSKVFYEQVHDTSNIGDIYHNMAMVYRDQKAYKKSIDYFRKTITIKQQQKEEKGVAIGYNMLGVAYRQSKKMDSALYCYQKAKAIFMELKDEENGYRVNSNLAAWYHTQKEYQKAIDMYLENLAYVTKTNQRLSLQRVYYNIAGGYMQLKQYKIALTYIEQALVLGKEQKAKSRISKSYLRKSFIQKKLNNYKGALENYRLYKKYSDSVFNIENAKKIQALELRHTFDQEKLADSLQFAKEKSELKLTNQAENSKKRLYLILLIMTILAAIAIGFLIRRIYKNRALMVSAELEKNKKEVADFTKQLIEKSNAQEALTKELEELKSEFGEQQSIKNLQELTNTKILTKDDWYMFREKFTTAYPQFFSAIKNKGYDLTKSEERLVAMEKLGLDTNQIANILAISEDSVIMNRYRLRKKINAPKGAPILKYLDVN